MFFSSCERLIRHTSFLNLFAESSKRLRLAQDLNASLPKHAPVNGAIFPNGIAGRASIPFPSPGEQLARLNAFAAPSALLQAGASTSALHSALEQQRFNSQLETVVAMRTLRHLREQELELQLLHQRREQLARAELTGRISASNNFSSFLNTSPPSAFPMNRSTALIGNFHGRLSAGHQDTIAALQQLPQPASLDFSNSSSGKKRPLDETSGHTDQGDGEDAEKHLSPFQSQQWDEHFKQLVKFRSENGKLSGVLLFSWKLKSRFQQITHVSYHFVIGHCNVPQHTHIDNPKLARWVKRQRYQYKLRIEGKPSNMTKERLVALDKIGFVWDSHSAVWEERFKELQDFHRKFQHCNVPTTYAENRQLAAWVKCQRRQYKLLRDNKPTNMNQERRKKLEALGFEWQLRSYHKLRKST